MAAPARLLCEFFMLATLPTPPVSFVLCLDQLKLGSLEANKIPRNNPPRISGIASAIAYSALSTNPESKSPISRALVSMPLAP